MYLINFLIPFFKLPVSFKYFEKLLLQFFLSEGHCLNSLFCLVDIIFVNELNEVSSNYFLNVFAWRFLFFRLLLNISINELDWRKFGFWIFWNYFELWNTEIWGVCTLFQGFGRPYFGNMRGINNWFRFYDFIYLFGLLFNRTTMLHLSPLLHLLYLSLLRQFLPFLHAFLCHFQILFFFAF